MPTTRSNAPRMDDVPIEQILSPEGVDDLITEFETIAECEKDHERYKKAEKAIKSVVPNAEEDPKRYVVNLPDGTGIGVIEYTLSSHKESTQKAGVTRMKKIRIIPVE